MAQEERPAIHNAFDERRKQHACLSGQEAHKHLGEAIGSEGKRKDVWVHVTEKKQEKKHKAK